MATSPPSVDSTETGASGDSPKRSASVLVAAGILLSRLSGVIRTSVFAAFLGVGGANDAFITATRIPNVLQMLLGEGTLSASFIPVYSTEIERDEEEAGRIAGAIASLLALVAAVIVILSTIFAEQIAWVVLLGDSNDARFDLTVTLLRIIFPSAGLLVLSGWCLGILNSHRQFFLSYVAPVLWNIAQIAAVVGGVVTVRSATAVTVTVAVAVDHGAGQHRRQPLRNGAGVVQPGTFRGHPKLHRTAAVEPGVPLDGAQLIDHVFEVVRVEP